MGELPAFIPCHVRVDTIRTEERIILNLCESHAQYHRTMTVM